MRERRGLSGLGRAGGDGGCRRATEREEGAGWRPAGVPHFGPLLADWF